MAITQTPPWSFTLVECPYTYPRAGAADTLVMFSPESYSPVGIHVSSMNGGSYVHAAMDLFARNNAGTDLQVWTLSEGGTDNASFEVDAYTQMFNKKITAPAGTTYIGLRARAWTTGTSYTVLIYRVFPHCTMTLLGCKR